VLLVITKAQHNGGNGKVRDTTTCKYTHRSTQFTFYGCDIFSETG